MQHRIDSINEKRLVGKCMRMSLVENRTGELWRSFMPERRLITNAIGTDLYSMQVYPVGYFKAFDPAAIFEKWAVAEVGDNGDVPDGMQSITLPGGLYAVFLHKGPASKGAESFAYIFGTWIPASEYEIDERPHFEVLGEKYKNEDPASEEEIWIPVKRKTS